MEKILIINTGGTFNKCYNEITGTLDISKNNYNLTEIISKTLKNNINYELVGVLFKDSLHLTMSDRKKIINEFKNYKKILIVHGTDTMDFTASFLEANFKDRVIVLTGAMKPFSIDKLEATSNFAMGIGFLNQKQEEGVYISMHGLVKEHKVLKKNKELGIFQCQK